MKGKKGKLTFKSDIKREALQLAGMGPTTSGLQGMARGHLVGSHSAKSHYGVVTWPEVNR